MICVLRRTYIVLVLVAVTVGGCTTFIERSAVQPPVRDGQTVLLRKGRAYGRLIIKQQRMDPETISYEWFYRTDGNGLLSSGQHSVRSGKSTALYKDPSAPYARIKFGPFSVGWSGRSDGEGYLYYDRFSGEQLHKDDLLICVVPTANKLVVDASDRRLNYRASPTDSGIAGNQSR